MASEPAQKELWAGMSAFGIRVDEDLVCICRPGMSKHDVLDTLVNLICARRDAVTDCEGFRKAVFERESVMSTGIGSGVAIPHVRHESILKPMLSVGVSAEGVDFDTLDNAPVHVVTMFAMPSGAQREYLQLLAQVMQSLKAPGFRDQLIACKTPAEAAALLNGCEA